MNWPSSALVEQCRLNYFLSSILVSRAFFNSKGLEPNGFNPITGLEIASRDGLRRASTWFDMLRASEEQAGEQ